MNKKLIKTVIGITCGLGVVSSTPFAITSCSNDKFGIKFTTIIKPSECMVGYNGIAVPSLNQHVYTTTGEKVEDIESANIKFALVKKMVKNI